MAISMRHVIQGLALALTLALAGVAGAQTAAPAAEPAKGPPADFKAPAEPLPDDTAAMRNRSQPGNNAPFWRAVRETGAQAGYTSLPGVEKGVLIQPLTQYPGSARTTAGEAWRQVRNQWIIPYGGSLLLIVLRFVQGLAIDEWSRGKMDASDRELREERQAVEELLG